MPEQKTQDICLHCCCGPCACGCPGEIPGRIACLYFSNSNLNTQDEYEKRLAEVEKLGRRWAVPVIADPYDHTAWLEEMRGLENEPEHGARCRKCFAFSFRRTAAAAAAAGKRFTSTLSVSPYKESAVILQIGSRFENFEPIDFGVGDNYRRGRILAKELGMYLQRYCGCEFSLRDAEKFKKQKKEALTCAES
ncbi:MAG: epoxyqueuosine reductase QueH [Victivallaceae bacterium]|nr:epoxyqueuosine reductase QueH [Victivallaceae bacterium]